VLKQHSYFELNLNYYSFSDAYKELWFQIIDDAFYEEEANHLLSEQCFSRYFFRTILKNIIFFISFNKKDAYTIQHPMNFKKSKENIKFIYFLL
jgi:hypothetical protein